MKLRRLWSTDWDAAPVALGSFLFSLCAGGWREGMFLVLLGGSHTTSRRFLHIGWFERFHCRTYGLCCPPSPRRTATACCRATSAHCKSGSSFWGTYVLDFLQLTSASHLRAWLCACSIVPLAGFGCCYSPLCQVFSPWPIVSGINMERSPAECESTSLQHPHARTHPRAPSWGQMCRL